MTRRLVLCALAALASIPAPADAATVIGDVSAPTNNALGPAVFLQTDDPAGRSFAVPDGGGVVTQVGATVAALNGAAKTVRVLFVRGTGPFTVVGHADIAFTGTGLPVVRTAAARIPVQAGDRLGVHVPADSAVGVQGMGDDVRVFSGGEQPADGAVLSNGSAGAFAGLITSATVEPDADRDGYGDETQDSCPGDPTVQMGTCTTDLVTTLRARPTGIPRNDVSVLIGTVTATYTALRATARLELPAGLQLVVASTTGGECIAFTCDLGTIPAGGQRRVYVTVRALSSGLQTARLTASSGTLDTDPADNTGAASVLVSDKALTTAPKLCRVPDLEGKKRRAARRALRRAGCRAGKVKGKKGRRARVRTQAVPAGVRVAAGTRIGFRLKRKPKGG